MLKNAHAAAIDAIVRQLATVCQVSVSRARSAIDAAIEAGSVSGKAPRMAIKRLGEIGPIVPELPLCEIADVFWSEAQNELIEYVTDSPVMQHASTGCVSYILKSDSAPRPHVIGKCDLRITTAVPADGGERQSFSFPGATITEITSDCPGEWVTHFWIYTPPAPTVAEAGRKGGTARARNLTKAERSNIARKAAQRRWKNP